MSTAAVDSHLNRAFRFYEASVGKKVVMAVTGFLLFAFVFVHMAGNLQIFEGAEKFNAYARFLRVEPAILWGARLTLLTAVVLHIISAVQLALLNQKARTIAYIRKDNSHSSYASRTMYWSGPIILVFIIWHLLDFTLGTVNPRYIEGSVYNNVIFGFQRVPVALFYILAMVLLCVHLYHGVYSMFQSVGIAHPRYSPHLKLFAKVFAIVLAIGFISVPLAVLAGLLQPQV